MYKHIICSIIFLFVLTSVEAQTPGLLGKRVTIFASLDHQTFGFAEKMNAFDSHTYIQEKSYLSLYFKFRKSLQVNYVLQRNLSLGLYGGYFKKDYDETRGLDIPKEQYYQSYDLGIQLKSFFWRRGAMAPIGFFTAYKLYWNRCKLFNQQQYSHSHPPVTLNPYYVDFAGTSFTIGKQSILYKNILFNAGFEASLLFTVYNLDKAPSRFRDSNIYSHAFHFFVGIGLCPI